MNNETNQPLEGNTPEKGTGVTPGEYKAKQWTELKNVEPEQQMWKVIDTNQNHIDFFSQTRNNKSDAELFAFAANLSQKYGSLQEMEERMIKAEAKDEERGTIMVGVWQERMKDKDKIAALEKQLEKLKDQNEELEKQVKELLECLQGYVDRDDKAIMFDQVSKFYRRSKNIIKALQSTQP